MDLLYSKKFIYSGRMNTTTKPKRSGNYKPGPGRPAGRKNNRTLALEAALREATAALPEQFEGDAHAFLASVYKNPAFPIEIRIAAAAKSIRVEKPALSSTQGRLEVTVGMAARIKAARARVIGGGAVPVAMDALPDSVGVEGGALDDATVIDGVAVVVDTGKRAS